MGRKDFGPADLAAAISVCILELKVFMNLGKPRLIIKNMKDKNVGMF